MLELEGLDASAVDLGAIGGAEVGENPGGTIEGDLSMVAGDGVIGEDELVVVGAAEGHALGADFEKAGGAAGGGELDARHGRWAF